MQDQRESDTYNFRSLKPDRFELVYVCLLKASNCHLVSGRFPHGGFASRSRATGIDLSPISRRLLEATLARGEVFRDFSILRVIRFRRTQQGLERYQGGFEGEDGGPGIFEDVETNGTRSRRHVGMVHLCNELHLDWLEWIRFGDHDILYP